MFDGMNDTKQQMELIQKLLKDENFRQLMMHPKFQSLMQDAEFMEAVKSRDKSQIMTHPKFVELKDEPGLKDLFTKIDFESFF